MRKSPRILFLDDNPERHKIFRARATSLQPHAEIAHVTTAKEAIKTLKGAERFDTISLDYDLDMSSTLLEPETFDPLEWIRFLKEREKESGLRVALFIARSISDEKLPSWAIIHSVNVEGAARMIKVLEKRILRVEHKPFDQTYRQVRKGVEDSDFVYG
jgi:CheY-like chemotaxis protein